MHQMVFFVLMCQTSELINITAHNMLSFQTLLQVKLHLVSSQQDHVHSERSLSVTVHVMKLQLLPAFDQTT